MCASVVSRPEQQLHLARVGADVDIWPELAGDDSIYQCDRGRAGELEPIARSRRKCWANVVEDHRLDRARERDSYNRPLLRVSVVQWQRSKN
jgi:hypothetical protein